MTMTNEENKEANKTSTVKPDVAEGMDRNEGETFNGTIGGTGSDLDKASQRLENEREGDAENDTSTKK